MATIANRSRRFTLGGRTLVGRAATCDLCVEGERISAEHAVVFWDGEAWWVRDLGSTNGTDVDGQRLRPGRKSALHGAHHLSFAGTVWRIEDLAPPWPRAHGLGGTSAEAWDGLLALPSADDPEVLVHRGDGLWLVEGAADTRVVIDGEQVIAGGERWRLELPASNHRPVATTLDGPGPVPTLTNVALAFEVSRDEEFVRLTAILPSGAQALKPRSFHYMLLTLARARLEDGAAGSESGWRYVDQLCVALSQQPRHLAVDIFRARQQFARLGVVDAARLIERRQTSRQVRLGVEQVSVRSL